jgi:hypothetical protein
MQQSSQGLASLELQVHEVMGFAVFGKVRHFSCDGFRAAITTTEGLNNSP